MVKNPTYPTKSYQVVEYEIPKEIAIFNRLSSVIFYHGRQFRNLSRVFKEMCITLRRASQSVKNLTFLRF